MKHIAIVCGGHLGLTSHIAATIAQQGYGVSTIKPEDIKKENLKLEIPSFKIEEFSKASLFNTYKSGKEIRRKKKKKARNK